MNEQQLTFRLASLNILWRDEQLATRLSLFTQEILQLQPDIICVQEIDALNQTSVITCLQALGYSHYTPTSLAPSYAKHWNLTFTKTPAVHDMIDLRLKPSDADVIPAVVTVTKISERPIHILNTHLAWGGHRAGYRMRQAMKLAAYAQRKKQETTIVLAGDLNTLPESETIRYLTGLQGDPEGNGTLWLDAWSVTGSDPASEITSDPRSNGWARETCLRHNLDPDVVPQRRIDYIFTHEWKYGGPGSPVRFGRFADAPDKNGVYISDHFGVWADIKL